MSHDPQRPAYDGDVFVLPAGASLEDAERLAETIQRASPGVKAIVVVGDPRHLDLAALGQAGWQAL
ncbi:hypothetical protein [Pseudomonas oryzihabitans]|uniref:Uncharacterized protein n=1 Tax=Pseudomonas oryzihabitans TaxID=47885 RepID=A0AAJ2BN83_9PSED|nr:hypothetical protein [Pseudomonas psychrotolerans]MDR6233529.1 hypothetical protein [Pseudomonas psychrotolerans]MDR6357431.1 hypothetical protein [Pseudomonas psychrotolerans]